MRRKGRIISWNDEKGYGFIAPDDGSDRIYVHITAFGNAGRRPALNQKVAFSVSADRRGRQCAGTARLSGQRRSQLGRTMTGLLSIIGAIVFLAVVAVLAAETRIPTVILAVYLVVSLIAFIVYAADKSAAKRGAWRTQENTLHLLSVAGGWPGALVAQQLLRHKSKKRSFRAVFWVTVIVNCAGLAWLLTPEGAAAARSLIGSFVSEL